MPYVRVREDRSDSSGLGCGPDCPCARCRQGSRWPQSGTGLSGLAESIFATDPRTSAQCRADERRITRVIEPPPGELVNIHPRYLADPSSPKQLHRAAYDAFLRLKAAAEADGIPPNLLVIVSGYRSIRSQQSLWENALNRYRDPNIARRWVAPPGGSPHHTGRAIDFSLGTRNDSSNIPALRSTVAYKWLVCNAERFGFTPYRNEPWHWEFNPPGFPTGTGPTVPAAPPRPTPIPSRSPVHLPVYAPPARRQEPSSSPAEIPIVGLPGFSPPEEKALRITTMFETGRPLNFGGLTGNFDNQGLSFGLLQWNIGTGSLQPLLREFATRFPGKVQAIFGPDAPRFFDILQPHRSLPEQMQFARSINDASQRHIVEPWRTYFARLAADPDFRQIQLRHVRWLMDVAKTFARRLGLRSERGLALMLDNVTQNGAGWLKPNRAALIQQRKAEQERQTGRPLTERQFLAVIANVVADTVNPRWSEDVRRRRMMIVNGTGVVHGTPMDLARQFGLTDQPWETIPGVPSWSVPAPGTMPYPRPSSATRLRAP